MLRAQSGRCHRLCTRVHTTLLSSAETDKEEERDEWIADSPSGTVAEAVKWLKKRLRQECLSRWHGAQQQEPERIEEALLSKLRRESARCFPREHWHQ